MMQLMLYANNNRKKSQCIECTTAISILLRDVKCERKKNCCKLFSSSIYLYKVQCRFRRYLALLRVLKKDQNFLTHQLSGDENAVRVKGMKNLLQSKVINK